MFVFWNQFRRFLGTQFENFPNFSSSLLWIVRIMPADQLFLALLWVLLHRADDQTATSPISVISQPRYSYYAIEFDIYLPRYPYSPIDYFYKPRNSYSRACGVSTCCRKEIGRTDIGIEIGGKDIGNHFVIIILAHLLAIFLTFIGIKLGKNLSAFKRKIFLYIPLSIVLVPIFLSRLLVLIELTNDRTTSFSGSFLSAFQDCPFASLFCRGQLKIPTAVLSILVRDINDTDHIFQLLLTFCLSRAKFSQPHEDVISERGNFSQPHEDVISEISKRLTFEDVVALSWVSRLWRSACLKMCWRPRDQFPWLMLSDIEKRSTKSFYSVGRNEIYELELPQAHGKRCHGSPYGWIVTMDPDLKAHLLHPLWQAQLSLPKLDTIRNRIGVREPVDCLRFIHKCILLKTSDSDSEDEFLVMVIFGPKHSLAFAKPGSVGWKTVVGADDFKDILLFKGQIHAICGKGRLRRFRSDNPESTPTLLADYPEKVFGVERIYLLESLGELLGVFRFSSSPFSEQRYDTKRFLVYMLGSDNDGNRQTWQRLNDLGDRALFVGEGNSWSVCIAKNSNWRSNCIYFTDDNWDQQVGEEEQTLVGHDIGVFDMVSKKIERLELGIHSPCYQSRSIWFTPSLLPCENYQARGVLPDMNGKTWKVWPAKQNMRH